MAKRTMKIAKWLAFLSLIGLLFSCQNNDSSLNEYIENLNINYLLEHCLSDGVYNGRGRFRLDITNYDDPSIVDDGRLYQAIMSSNPTPTALNIQESPALDLADLITYSSPSYDYSYVVIYSGDYLGCEINVMYSHYYRYYSLSSGKAQELYELALDIMNGEEV